jgi:uroporphyrin-3 C-methyltransferase
MTAMSEIDTPLATIEPETAAAMRPARGRIWIWIVLALAAGAIVYFVWQTWTAAQGQLRAAQDERSQLGVRIEALARTAEQARGNADSLRERLDDATKVNQSLRDQILGLGERARLMEDAVANLADKRLSGHDAMLLNEAEMLLALGAERYALFHDVQATVETYRLADTALAAVDDAAFSSVRQSIQSELEAFAALKQPGVAGTLASLAALRSQAAGYPGPARELPPAQPGASRWARLLGQFVRVRHGQDSAALVERHDIALARELFVLDLRDAEAALLARDEVRWHAALADADAVLGADFDADAGSVKAARRSLATLAQQPLAPAAPANFGSALRELRNLRATHALRQAPTPADAPTAPAEGRK